MCDIIPGPGTMFTEFPPIAERIERILPFANAVHIDIVDGKFADNLTFMDPAPFKKYANDILLEVHLMVEEPLQYLKPFANAGFQRFIGHIEKMSDIPEFVAQGQLLGEVGLAVDGKTPIEAISDISPEDLDVVLVMTINAGFSGQSFMPEYLEKVKKLREKSTTLPIQIDGGVNADTIITAKEAGVTRFVVTSAIYNQQNPYEAYRLLQKALQ